MRLLVIGIVSVLAAFWFGLSFIHSAWVSATPVPDPTPYQHHAMVYFALTVASVLTALTTLVLAWRRRNSPPGSHTEE